MRRSKRRARCKAKRRNRREFSRIISFEITEEISADYRDAILGIRRVHPGALENTNSLK